MREYAVSFSKEAYAQKLEYGSPSWNKFNGSFTNLETSLNGILTFIYKGHAITTQHDKWRKTENYLRGQHIGLDFDTEDENSKISTLARDKFIQKYGAFIHTTISYTEEKPRARVIFLLDQPIMQAKNYGLAATALLWLFGTADRQCKDAARFFYGSPGCEFETIGQELPLVVIKKMINKYQESGAMERKQAVRPNYLPPASQQEVAEALKVIPPWSVTYDQWLAILMGIHAEFGEAGYFLAENWGDGKPGEVERKWKSFKPIGNGSGAVTIATVFGIAKEYGWSKL